MTTSASPDRNARSGRVSSVARLDHHESRHVERPGHVLPRRKVDRGLAPESAVGGGQKRRRHLNDRHPAQRERRGETGDVPDRPAPEGDDPAVPLQAP